VFGNVVAVVDVVVSVSARFVALFSREWISCGAFI
jgi:hypothetical protein